MTDTLVEKYRPEKLSDVKGNPTAIKAIKQWAEKWQKGETGKPLLLHGDPGTGKTSTAIALSKQFDWPLNHVNLSDSRRSDEILTIAEIAESKPVDDDYQLVLLDEVDNFDSRVNHDPLSRVLKNPQNPIICTANDSYSVPNWLSGKTHEHKFNLRKSSRRNHLEEIAESEGFELSQQDINKLAERPDLRSAINDMSFWAGSDVPPDVDTREWESNRFQAISKLLKCDSEWKDIMSPSDRAFTPPDAMFWAAENLSSQWRGLEAAVAYNALSQADMNIARAERTRNYRYWKYASAFLERLPDTRLTEPYMGYVNVDYPSWQHQYTSTANGDTAEATLFRKLKGEWGFSFAGSFNEFRQDIIPILKSLDGDRKKEIALNYDLTDSEMSVLGLDGSQFDEWAVPEKPQKSEWKPETNSATDW